MDDEPKERTRDQARKWKLAEWLDKRYPALCWADLATWAMGYREWEGVETQGRCNIHDEQFLRYGGCYCGKHQVTP
jgi:hypothetical protein